MGWCSPLIPISPALLGPIIIALLSEVTLHDTLPLCTQSMWGQKK